MIESSKVLRRIVTGIGAMLLMWGAVGCASAVDSSAVDPPVVEQSVSEAVPVEKGIEVAASAGADAENLETAIFAGGCFWCMEQPFDALPGVVETTSGYTGGDVENPTYEAVSSGGTGHFEAMEVVYDPEQVSYDTLLETFWYNVDPVDSRGQFCDKGSQYLSAIFYDSAEQQAEAEASKDAIASRLKREGIKNNIATEILPAATFYDAEGYHQNYYLTHPVRYKVYRYGCGRDQRLEALWGADAPNHE